jgi:hypothetical protein
MNSDSWLWAQRAQDLRFHQFESARKQAESWRTGLAGLTALFGTVLVIKGNADLTSLRAPYPQIVVALLGAAFSTLIMAVLLALRATSGAPGDELLLTGEDLQEWTRAEVLKIGKLITTTRRLSVVSFVIIAIAIGLAWLGPQQAKSGQQVLVDSANFAYCGYIVTVNRSYIVLDQGGQYRSISLSSISEMKNVSAC